MVVGGPTITLSNGTKMPQVGLGTWQSKPEEVKAAVKTAVEAGYRLIDTATCYENESAIGDAIKELIQEGKVTRERSSSLPPSCGSPICILTTPKLEFENHLVAFQRRLNLRRPLPCTFPDHDMTEQNPSVTVQDIWRGLEGVYKKGLTKAIGVELYLYWPQHELHEVCKKHNISLTSYGSLGSPGRVNFSLPSGAKLVWAPAPNPFEDENVKNLAKKYSKTPAQVC
ncbi:oxidoreductase, aldo/keto reductase family protein [Ostertagia ostertagi]